MLAKESRPNYPKDLPLAVSVFRCNRQIPHYHPDTFELLLCLSGNLQVTSMHEKHLLKAGDLIQADMYDVHSAAGTEDTLAASIHIDLNHPLFSDAEYKLLFYVCSSDDLSLQQIDQISRIRLLLLAILSNWVHDENVRDNLDMAQELLHIMRENFQYFDRINEDEDKLPKELKDRFERIMAYMLGHYSEKVTMADICQMEHISYNYLSRFFKASSLKTFQNFLHEIRVYHSEHMLLCRPELSVPEVGYLVGFSDPKLFYREFRKKHGHTPHQHRIWYRKYNEQVKPDKFLTPEEDLEEIERVITRLLAEAVRQAI